MSEILLNYTRAGKVESIHRGDIAVVDVKGKVIDAIGDAHRAMFWRSAAKPFQVLPFVKQGGMQQYNITGEELALMVSSHSGENLHVELTNSILGKVGLSANVLACGPARPMDGRASRELVKLGQKPEPVHNPCSGKHSAMLALCQMLGLPVEGYTEDEHQVQKIMHQAVAASACLSPEKLEIGIDGCGVPVFYLPIYNMALAYARLVKPESGNWGEDEEAITTIRNAMLEYPQVVAGTGRIDTVLMNLTKGRILAKVGAEAVYCLASVPDGIGITFKIEDGGHRAINPVIIGILKKLDLITTAEYDELIAKFPPILKNHRGDIIGTIETTF
ncbi:asparaginase [Dendrosporobacter sp. 1207_IL3150]|uniref:asparaginase n=1 Tax=Dendrosporobacter sp. 1207_IL3150 TaxID=3084054 RepID=UPI002FD97ABC